MPPATLKSIAPLVPPLQAALVTVFVKLKGAAGCVMVVLAVAVQLLASVAVTLYVPAAMLDISSVVAPFDQRKVYGDVPPVGVKLTAPVLCPKQRTFVPMDDKASAAAGCVTVKLAVKVQFWASVIVTV